MWNCQSGNKKKADGCGKIFGFRNSKKNESDENSMIVGTKKIFVGREKKWNGKPES
jgi:hypothetical protein